MVIADLVDLGACRGSSGPHIANTYPKDGDALFLAHLDNQADFLVFRHAASMDLVGKDPYPVLGSASVYSEVPRSIA